MTVECAELRDAQLGASIAVNGVCLTLAALDGARLSFDVVPETIARTNLGALAPGDAVNIERSVRLGEELGGHLVYGHVDATTVVLSKHAEGNGARMWCVIPPGQDDVIAEKGYVTLDGVSLTIASLAPGQFSVALVPETLARTTLGSVEAGSALNFEADPIARYVAHVLREKDRR